MVMMLMMIMMMMMIIKNVKPPGVVVFTQMVLGLSSLLSQHNLSETCPDYDELCSSLSQFGGTLLFTHIYGIT